MKKIWKFLLVLLVTPLFSPRLHAQVNSHKTILVWPNGAPGAKGNTPADKPSLTIFRPSKENDTGSGVLVCPGGGYVFEAMDKEGYKVAKWLNTLGIAAFVLKYRHGNRYRYPAPFEDATRAMRIIRDRAAEWHIKKDKIGIMGFSAGGHLASTVGTHFDMGNPNAKDPLKRVSSRPDFMILVYPVITMEDSFTHEGSKHALLGPNPNPKLVELLSNEKHVTSKTPPAFIVQATTDPVVPVQNSVAFYEALQKHGVPVEMHLYQHGPHGFGLAKNFPLLHTWPGLCKNWLKYNGYLKVEK